MAVKDTRNLMNTVTNAMLWLEQLRLLNETYTSPKQFSGRLEGLAKRSLQLTQALQDLDKNGSLEVVNAFNKIIQLLAFAVEQVKKEKNPESYTKEVYSKLKDLAAAANKPAAKYLFDLRKH